VSHSILLNLKFIENEKKNEIHKILQFSLRGDGVVVRMRLN